MLNSSVPDLTSVMVQDISGDAGACLCYQTTLMDSSQCASSSATLDSLIWTKVTHHRPFLVTLCVKSGPSPPLPDLTARKSLNCVLSVNNCSQRARVSDILDEPP